MTLIEKTTEKVPSHVEVLIHRCTVCGKVERTSANPWHPPLVRHYVHDHVAAKKVEVDDRTRELFYVPDADTFAVLRAAEGIGKTAASGFDYESPGWYVVLTERDEYDPDRGERFTIIRAEEWAKGIEERAAALIGEALTVRALIRGAP